MPKNHLGIVDHVNFLGMFLVGVFALEVGVELLLLVFASLSQCWFFLFFDPLVEEELIVEIEVAFGDDLEERLPVEIDFVVVIIGLVVDIGVGESEWEQGYPLDMISPFIYLPGTVLTPCNLRISPHFIFSCASDIKIFLN